nr:MAG TPA: Baseplate wedge protein [Caudoviricetes sp.]
MALNASYIFKKIWAWSNTANAPLPPDTQAVPNSGRTSLALGFPPECSKAIADGGVPPYGQDVNGILRQITANLEWYSRGGQFAWDASRSYDTPAIVFYNGAFYMALKSSANQTPSANSNYWRKVLDYTDFSTIQTQIESQITDALTGTIQWFACDAGQQGSEYLICDGRAVSRTAYAKLFAKIGTKYGAGNNSGTFNLPNLVGRVAWGATNSIGTKIDPGLPNITGTFNAPESSDMVATGAVYLHSKGYKGASKSDWDNWLYGFDASRSNAIYGRSSTVQPPALTLLPCIHI